MKETEKVSVFNKRVRYTTHEEVVEMIKKAKSRDEELKKIVMSFVKGLNKKQSKSRCFMTCLPLQTMLSMAGFQTELLEVEIESKDFINGHWVLQLPDGRIIDPTADQFNDQGLPDMPQVYIGEKPERYKLIS